MRIVVVEDEYRVRNGIIKLINKIKPQYEIAGEAENGLQGMEIIMAQKPDLVIVDIKMPMMDGIEMLTQLKEKGVKHKTVILSGYSDFEYAQKAIKLGVCEYLLKPVTADDLEQTLLNAEKEINMERVLENNQTQVFSSLENIFRNLVLSGGSNVEQIYEYLEDKSGINTNGGFAVINIYIGSSEEINKTKVKNLVSQVMSNYGKADFCSFELTLHREIIGLAFNCEDFAALERYFQNTGIKALLREQLHGLAFGWIYFKGLDNLKNSLSTIRKELKWSMVLGEDVLISYPKTHQINTKFIQYPIEIESNAKAAVCAFDNVKLQRFFEDFLSWWRKELYHPAGVIESFIRFASSIINVIKELDYKLYEKINQKEILQGIIDAITWNELEKALYSITDRISLNKDNETQIVNLAVKKTLRLVDEFYKDGITLDQIAARLNITPEYLGSIFNRELGVNFSTYIKEYRIKKAKELLIAKELKTYEIAEKVGYADPKYFCRVFKETTGLTPGEFQKTYK